jgi:hypothetical protein
VIPPHPARDKTGAAASANTGARCAARPWVALLFAVVPSAPKGKESRKRKAKTKNDPPVWGGGHEK